MPLFMLLVLGALVVYGVGGRDRVARANRAGVRAGVTAGRTASRERWARTRPARETRSKRTRDRVGAFKTGRGLLRLVDGIAAIGSAFWWLVGATGNVVGAVVSGVRTGVVEYVPAARSGLTGEPAPARPGAPAPPTLSVPPVQPRPAPGPLTPNPAPARPGAGAPPAAPGRPGAAPDRPAAPTAPAPGADGGPAGGPTPLAGPPAPRPAPSTTTTPEAETPMADISHNLVHEWTNADDMLADATTLSAAINSLLDSLVLIASHAEKMPDRAQAAADRIDPGPDVKSAIAAFVDSTPKPAALSDWADQAHALVASMRSVMAAVQEPVATTGVGGRVESWQPA